MTLSGVLALLRCIFTENAIFRHELHQIALSQQAGEQASVSECEQVLASARQYGQVLASAI